MWSLRARRKMTLADASVRSGRADAADQHVTVERSTLDRA